MFDMVHGSELKNLSVNKVWKGCRSCKWAADIKNKYCYHKVVCYKEPQVVDCEVRGYKPCSHYEPDKKAIEAAYNHKPYVLEEKNG